MGLGFKDFIGPITQVGTGIYNSERNRSYSNAQRDWEEKMWHMNNEYNTPKAQRERLVDAGLNPALMYQTMPQNVSQAASGGSTAHSEMRFDPSSFLMAAQLEAIKANTEQTRVATQRQWFDLEREKINADFKTKGLQLDNTGKDVSNQIQEIERQYRAESLQLKNLGFDLSNKQTQKFLGQMDERFKNEMSKMVAEIGNLIQNTQTSKSLQGLNESQTKATDIRAVIDRFEADARRSGWSYGDNIIFRQIVSAISEMANQAFDQYGRGYRNNTNVVKSTYTLLQALFGD